LSFNVTWSSVDKVVKLDWETVNEIDIDYYIIERKAQDEANYHKVGKASAKGGRETVLYTMIDAEVVKGQIYEYRLTPVNLDGRTDGQYLANVIVPADKLTVNAYPNPVKDLLSIVIAGVEGNDVSIEILDNVGRRVMEKMMIERSNTAYEKVTMNLSDLPQGQYYIKVVSGQRVEIKKLVHVR